MSDTQSAVERELTAIQGVIGALGVLDAPAKARVLRYSLEHLGMSMTDLGISPIGKIETKQEEECSSSQMPNSAERAVKDIKRLKEEKNPSSAIEMAAVVAYYLAEELPEDSRKPEFGFKDAEALFRQAGFKLPPNMRDTLNNAKKSGFLEGLGQGKFKLTPVGYNLVAHDLPSKRK